MNIQPLDIKEKIEKIPLALRSAAAKGYVGIKPSTWWEMEFFHLSDVYGDDAKWSISGVPKGKLYPDVQFQLQKKEHPEFNSLNQGDIFRVKGIISEVSNSGLHIHLRDPVVQVSRSENPYTPNSLSSSYDVIMNSTAHYRNDSNTDKSRSIVGKTIQNKWLDKFFVPLLVTIVGGLILGYLYDWFGLGN